MPQNAPAVFATINANLDSTLATLRQEGGVKHEIIVVGLYNVLYPAIFQQTLAQTGNDSAAAAAAGAASDQLAIQLNVAAGGDGGEVPRGVRQSVPGVQPAGQPARRVDSICTKTGVCAPPNDIHPTDAGYAALGGRDRASRRLLGRGDHQ